VWRNSAMKSAGTTFQVWVLAFQTMWWCRQYGTHGTLFLSDIIALHKWRGSGRCIQIFPQYWPV
jgi:hypothetical protein